MDDGIEQFARQLVAVERLASREEEGEIPSRHKLHHQIGPLTL
jgi:hypothetical protein